MTQTDITATDPGNAVTTVTALIVELRAAQANVVRVKGKIEAVKKALRSALAGPKRKAKPVAGPTPPKAKRAPSKRRGLPEAAPADPLAAQG